ncbi:hypothetical protein BGI33_02045 [Snodgrassella alvi]|nr:hypothetical protein BGI33_02045 [Snodgrassella alvi]PIT19189.1 hypothetical protein BGI34_03505 [Snodgrassella alvi]
MTSTPKPIINKKIHFYIEPGKSTFNNTLNNDYQNRLSNILKFLAQNRKKKLNKNHKSMQPTKQQN